MRRQLLNFILRDAAARSLRCGVRQTQPADGRSVRAEEHVCRACGPAVKVTQEGAVGGPQCWRSTCTAQS